MSKIWPHLDFFWTVQLQNTHDIIAQHSDFPKIISSIENITIHNYEIRIQMLWEHNRIPNLTQY